MTDYPDIAGPVAAGTPPLAGFRIGVTAHRRASDLIEALERRGAEVLHAPALRIAPVADDNALLEDTRRVIATRPNIVMVTTAYGMRRWCEAADAAGLGEDLLEVLERARIFVRGPKARGAVRAAGLSDAGISSDETTATLTNLVIAAGVRGHTTAVQVHGYTDVTQLDRLRAAGAEVLTVTPYRWVSAQEDDRLPQLIDAVCRRELDVLTFTSAPAVDAMLSTAAEAGRRDEFLAALGAGAGDGPAVATAVVGPVTGAPLLAAGVTPLVPARFRMGALIRLVCEHLEATAVARLQTRDGLVEVRGRAVRIDGNAVPLAPAPLALLRELMAADGAVLSREALCSGLGLGESDNALHMAVSRLRAALPDPGLVETVVKRGYRLRI
ncbi:uroporphyrinogen-III synthase [Specibacter cremeus]|uniref:uroporphyrinogen-III synthase n=1 Tax=Specibacter cremeus TaxID=1629051 RepID=UPI000F78C1DB|nr:uroporphyrinogen-III synthase [Specibacter cremeus]